MTANDFAIGFGIRLRRVLDAHDAERQARDPAHISLTTRQAVESGERVARVADRQSSARHAATDAITALATFVYDAIDERAPINPIGR